MRILFTLLASIAFLVPRAQTLPAHLPVPVSPMTAGGWGFTPWQPFIPYGLMLDGSAGQRWHGWQLRPYGSLSAGYIFWGGGISYVSAPVGVIAYRPLSTNFTAFGAAAVAPTVFDFNRFAGQPMPGNNLTGLGVNASVTGGLIYTNEAKTFSISGSISVERGSSPVYFQNRTNNTKQY
jgi:hypothetical protein